VEVAAYRIITEAVANAIRHGRPSHCEVRLRTTGHALELIIADNGTGMRADATLGVGLTSMRERAAEVGGTFTIDSGSAGTTVTAGLPLERT
jgi:signal transduction histidine kinase